MYGVQGVECSNHSVPTNEIKDLAQAGEIRLFLFRVLVRNLVRKNLLALICLTALVITKKAITPAYSDQ